MAGPATRRSTAPARRRRRPAPRRAGPGRAISTKGIAGAHEARARATVPSAATLQRPTSPTRISSSITTSYRAASASVAGRDPPSKRAGGRRCVRTPVRRSAPATIRAVSAEPAQPARSRGRPFVPSEHDHRDQRQPKRRRRARARAATLAAAGRGGQQRGDRERARGHAARAEAGSRTPCRCGRLGVHHEFRRNRSSRTRRPVAWRTAWRSERPRRPGRSRHALGPSGPTSCRGPRRTRCYVGRVGVDGTVLGQVARRPAPVPRSHRVALSDAWHAPGIRPSAGSGGSGPSTRPADAPSQLAHAHEPEPPFDRDLGELGAEGHQPVPPCRRPAARAAGRPPSPCGSARGFRRSG